MAGGLAIDLECRPKCNGAGEPCASALELSIPRAKAKRGGGGSSVVMESLYRVPGEHHHMSHCTAIASSDS